MQTILKIFKILIIVSIVTFILTCSSNSAMLNIAFVSFLLAWIVIQIKESKNLSALDYLFVLQILSEIAMIVLGILMLDRAFIRLL